ncbi:MAG: response regulator [Myxococcaceae bacterium]|nr:response regulator [Myxococcaceae bacterium]
MLVLSATLVGLSALLGLTSRLVSGTGSSGAIVVGLVLAAGCALTVLLARRGRIDAAAWLFLPLAWAMVGAISVARGGLYSGTVGLYLLCTVLAGVIVSARAAVIVCGLSVAGCLGLLLGEDAGLIRADPGMSLFQRGLTAVLTLGVTTAVFLVALRRLRRSLAETRAAREELLRGNDELRLAQAGLEEVVRQRTQSLLEARDQALAAARTKMSFLANMSHELRTPMNAIVGVTELLKLRPLDAESSEFVKLMSDSADALVKLLDDVLDLAKIEAGRLVIERSAWDVRATVTEVIALMTPQARARRLAISSSIADDVPQTVLGDRTRVRQILLNLTANALKFTDRGVVELSVSTAPDERLRFSVRDTGRGIDPAEQERLFRPFEQLDSTTTRRHGGTGLGLAISRQLAELMNGAIGVTSAVGVGSTFWFTVHAPTATRPEPVAAPAPTGGPLPRRVLVVEDNAANQRIVTTLIEQLGCTVAVVDSGADALERCTREPFDVILMDIMMPGLDGRETTRRLRAQHGEKPWIVALTASALPEDERAARSAGVDDFVSKPVNLEALRQSLERAFARRPRSAAS